MLCRIAMPIILPTNSYKALIRLEEMPREGFSIKQSSQAGGSSPVPLLLRNDAKDPSLARLMLLVLLLLLLLLLLPLPCLAFRWLGVGTSKGRIDGD